MSLVIKVFSASLARDREVIGERATEWIKQNSHLTIIETRTLQSSDQAYHCLTMVIVAEEPPPAPKGRRKSS